MYSVIFCSVEYHCLCGVFPDKSKKTIGLFPLYDFCHWVENNDGIIGRLSTG